MFTLKQVPAVFNGVYVQISMRRIAPLRSFLFLWLFGAVLWSWEVVQGTIAFRRFSLSTGRERERKGSAPGISSSHNKNVGCHHFFTIRSLPAERAKIGVISRKAVYQRWMGDSALDLLNPYPSCTFNTPRTEGDNQQKNKHFLKKKQRAKE